MIEDDRDRDQDQDFWQKIQLVTNGLPLPPERVTNAQLMSAFEDLRQIMLNMANENKQLKIRLACLEIWRKHQDRLQWEAAEQDRVLEEIRLKRPWLTRFLVGKWFY